MKKSLLPVLILCLLLSGCGKSNTTIQTTAPMATETSEVTEVPETTIPTEVAETAEIPETTVPTEITGMTVQDFTEYYDLLSFSGNERNWIYFSMGCLFSNPQEIPLNFLFYLGVDHPGSWMDISPESQQYLVDQGFTTEMDLQIMPVGILEQIMQDTFGVSLSDVPIPSEWDYIEAENAYCSNHSDAYIPGPFTISAVTEYNNGTVEITYETDMFYDGSTGEFYDQPTLILTLSPRENGNWLVLSNCLK